jgi:transcriptional regulator with XRE-family HTH domain
MSEKVRIEKVIQMVGLTSGLFAQEIGIQTSTLSHILNERNKPSLDVMKKILNRYPNINAEWLILGQGSIQRKESHSQAPTLFGDEDINGSISDSNIIYEPKKNDAEIFSFQHQTVKSEPVPVYTHPKTEIQQEKSHSFDKTDSTTQPPIMNNEIDVAQKLVDAVENLKQNQIIEKKVRKIILYYSDNTFQEFESK